MTQQARRACRLPVPSGKRGFRPQTAAAICGAIIPRKQKESSPPSLNALLFTDRVKMSIEGQLPTEKKLFLLPPQLHPSFRDVSCLDCPSAREKGERRNKGTRRKKRDEGRSTRGGKARTHDKGRRPRVHAQRQRAPLLPADAGGTRRASRPLCERRKHTQEDVPFTKFRGNEQDIRTRGRPFVRTRKSA